MSNPPPWVGRARFGTGVGELNMPGIAAGVKTQADVNSQPSQPSRMSRSLGNPATWSYIWAGAAFLYLATTYLGLVSIRRLAN